MSRGLGAKGKCRGSDSDKHGCKGSSGYTGCAQQKPLARDQVRAWCDGKKTKKQAH